MKSDFGKVELPVFHVFLLTHFLNPEVPVCGVACRSLAHDSRSELGDRHAMELIGTGVSAKRAARVQTYCRFRDCFKQGR